MLGRLGKYELKRELGRGAMGVVYEGFDPVKSRIVAIKTIQKSMLDGSDAQNILLRFRREALAAECLTHPNIVSVYEYDEDNDVAFIAMEHVVGIELKEHFDKATRFKASDCVRIMSQLLDALEYSHARGVVHRDIKPANILITREGQVKIADFGIARMELSDLTQKGTVLGTPSYMSPEQVMGQTADRRSDVYSTGILLYQFLTGVKPFTGGNTTDIMGKVLNEMPVNPGTLNPGLPKTLVMVVEKAIAKRPDDRFQSAADFLKALKLSTAPQATAAQAPPTVLSTNSEVAMPKSQPEQSQQVSEIGIRSTIDFCADDFDARLKATQQDANRRSGITESAEKADNSLGEVKLNFDHFIPQAKVEPVVANVVNSQPSSQTQAFQADATGSNLLAGLALEAKEKQGLKQSTLQETQAKAKRVDDALNRIANFLNPFSRHVNQVEPQINRLYRFDAKTEYTNLKWHAATVDYRKQSLAETALMEYVAFSVHLCAPEPLVLRRPLGPLDTLKKELQHLRLRMIDEFAMSSANSRSEWQEIKLAPDFPVQIRFQGNYHDFSIDVLCRNVEAFGVTTYKLSPDDIAPDVLDSLGLFLLGRSAKLPVQMKRV